MEKRKVIRWDLGVKIVILPIKSRNYAFCANLTNWENYAIIAKQKKYKFCLIDSERNEEHDRKKNQII